MTTEILAFTDSEFKASSISARATERWSTISIRGNTSRLAELQVVVRGYSSGKIVKAIDAKPTESLPAWRPIE
jgi:hypothetical protein